MRQIVERLRTIAEELKSKGLSVKIDDRDNVRSGFKFAEYELKGVPVRLALGPRDLENGTIELVRRDDYQRGHVGRIRRCAGKQGRLHLGPLGRDGRNRSGDQGRYESHDPLHPDGGGRGGGQMRIQRQTVASPRTFRPQLLNAVDTELSQRRRMPFREVSVFVFAGNRS